MWKLFLVQSGVHWRHGHYPMRWLDGGSGFTCYVAVPSTEIAKFKSSMWHLGKSVNDASSELEPCEFTDYNVDIVLGDENTYKLVPKDVA